jgi:hypothetical protein
MGMSDRNVDICLECGVEIEHATFEMKCWPFGMAMGKQIHCLECGFNVLRRSKTCCPKPYRDPWERHTKEGRAPERVRRDLDAMKNGTGQDGMMGGAL